MQPRPRVSQDHPVLLLKNPTMKPGRAIVRSRQLQHAASQSPRVGRREPDAESPAARPSIPIERQAPNRALRRAPLAAALAAVCLATPFAAAGIVTWDVDPSASYIRLAIPDQDFDVPDVGEVTLRMRDAGNNSQWTDAGGRRAALDGEIVTEYVDGVSIAFLGGHHNLYALEQTSLRPNPAKWSPAKTNYTDTSTAPAALGGRARGALLLTFDIAFVAFRNVQLDLTNTTTGPLPVVNGAFAANTTRFGILSALADVDGLELPLGLGQPVPDLLHASVDPVVRTNASGGAITNPGGPNRQLTYTINLPDLVLDLGGTLATGSATGLIVAYAVLPEPPLPPVLALERHQAEIVLAWPAHPTGFTLEYATRLPAQDWLPAAPPPVLLGDRNVVTNKTLLDAVFYRLRWLP